MNDPINQICRKETPADLFSNEGSSSEPSDLSHEIMPVYFGGAIASPKTEFKIMPNKIDSPMLVVVNPVAGGGAGIRASTELHRSFSLEQSSRRTVFGNGVFFYETIADHTLRIPDIISTITEVNSDASAKAPAYVIVCGGDGTFVEACEAAYAISKDGGIIYAVPYKGGTANDMRIELGVPKSASKMTSFLETAVPVKLDVITARINDGGPRLVVHTQGNGVSGDVFVEVQRLRELTGKSSVFVYLIGIVKGVWNTKVFYVRVNGGEPIAVGEVITLAGSTSVGSVTNIPLPERGGAILLIPVDSRFNGLLKLHPSIGAFLNAFYEGLRSKLGDQTVLAPGRRPKFIPEDRFIPVEPGTTHTLEFGEMKNGEWLPKPVNSVLNGDPLKNTYKVEITATGETIEALAAPNSRIRVRQGLVAPTTMTEVFGQNVRSLARASIDFSAKAAPFALIGAYEVYKDVVDMPMENRALVDRYSFLGVMLMDAYTTSRFGVTPFIAQMPRIAPWYLAGDISAGYFMNEAGKELGIEQLTYGRASNTLIRIGAGATTTAIGTKLVGEGVSAAVDQSVFRFLVNTVGGAGSKVEGLISGALRFVNGGTFPFFFITINPILIDPCLIPSENDPECFHRKNQDA